MSLSSAISYALSGMRASSAAAEVAGNNLANATNENYTRRELITQSNTGGSRGGVQIVGVHRHVDPVMAATWREANGTATMASQTSQDASAIQTLYGDPTQPGALTNRLTRFRESLVSASARPDQTERLGAAVSAFDDVVRSINEIGDGIQDRRAAADRQIADLTMQMNDTLANLKTLNVRIADASTHGNDPSSLLDQQDSLVDALSAITDIRVYARDNNTIAIYSVGGMALLDNSASEISFDRTGVVTADLSVAAGHLGSLVVNGETVSVGAESGRIRGGQLGALFEFRDVTAVAEQVEIDAFAFEFAQRLNDPAIDPTRGTGAPGFLTDQGALVDVTNLVGLSSRLAINADINPAQGGDARLLRDGTQAVAAGPVGNSSLLDSLSARLTTQDTIGNGSFSGERVGLADMAVRMTNRVAYSLAQSEQAQAFANSQSEILRSYKLAGSVDTDIELQNLMTLEQAYAANAQVLRTVDEMMDTLLGIL